VEECRALLEAAPPRPQRGRFGRGAKGKTAVKAKAVATPKATAAKKKAPAKKKKAAAKKKNAPAKKATAA